MTRPPFTPETLSPTARSIVARAKTAELREHLANPPGAFESLSLLVRCLLLALAGDNVEVSGQSKGDHENFAHLVPVLVNSAGRLEDLSGAQVLDLVGEALSRLLVITDSLPGQGSGPVAEWIGQALDVPPPRLDTAEFLGTLDAAELRRIARANAVSLPDRSTPVARLRQALSGRLPNFRPVGFGAPGPTSPHLPHPADGLPETETEVDFR